MLGRIILLGVLGVVANAEESSAFVGINYQVSMIQNQTKMVNSSGTQKPLMKFPPYAGAGFQIGYKQFFGKKKWFGLRYYGFFDYNHNRFGVMKKGTPIGDSSFIYNSFSFGGNTLTERDSYQGQYYVNLFTYGAGLDTLWNFVNKENMVFGFVVGIQLAGDSWASSIGNEISNYVKHSHNGSTYSPANFQFLWNFGIRTHIAKYNSLELGIKVPTITHKYFYLVNEHGDTLQANVRRVYAFQISYMRDF
ncbi:outer membrane protein [Helicobacter cetorum]|uniref:outer membrane protein n=1 Tax=Helicobacter cetorum TaxID=138563 RepID=UPI000CF09A21|nr:outer membrane protein [Helicobacter cetorum]